MSNETQTPAERLRHTIELLAQERAQLQIVGRALTPEEQQRVERIGQALPLLRDALSRMEGTSPGVEPEPPAATLSDGRYEGGNQEMFVELRVDESGSGVISDTRPVNEGG